MPKNTDLDRRSRIFMLRLYPDNEAHCQALELVQSKFKNYAFALHDKDIYEEDIPSRDIKAGDLKKPHWHVVVKFQDARTRSSVVKDLLNLISILDIIPFSGVKEGLLYLVHAENEEKYQYDKNIVEGPLKCDFLGYYAKVGLNEYEVCQSILNFIDSQPACTLNLLYQFCIQSGYMSIYRRYYMIFKDLLQEQRKYVDNYKRI